MRNEAKNRLESRMLGNLHVRFGVGVGMKSPGLHHNGKPGINSRLALLEEWRGNSTWLNRTLLGAVVLLVLRTLWELMTARG